MTAHWRTPAGLHTSPARLPVEGRLPSFDGATGWLNSPPLTTADLQGKVTLVNFWTYTCINWLRQLPYLRAWAGKYVDHRLAVIGVHTPEFGFEQDLDNVCRAVRDMRIDYPVALDNDYAVWSAFDNNYWPALYFADAQGASGTITSAKANTSSRKWSSSSCWSRRERPTMIMSLCRSRPGGQKPRPTGPH
jgi:thiol-disulfide isomerase/thioredoxin